MSVFIAAAALLLSTVPMPQQRPAVIKPTEMKKFDWMIGKWQGDGWMEFGPNQRRTSKVSETVYRKAGGHVVVFEGLGKARVSDGGPEVVVHDAFGVVWFDRKTKKYRINAYKANGQLAETEVKMLDGAMQWGFKGPYGNVRFTIEQNDAGQWTEIGEMERGEAGWHKFFEMKLNRVK